MSLPAPAEHSFVVVTGAAAGIGLELARCLAGRGHQLLLVDRDGERLTAVAAELGADSRVCDLTVKRQRDSLIAAIKRDERALVGLCNNAGIFSLGRFHELPVEREREMVEVNAVAVHHLTGALLPLMVARGQGAILNTASVAANQPLPGCATYAATKAFVHSFSEAVHSELTGTGVSCTSLQPGVTSTNIAINAGLADESEPIPRLLSASATAVARAGVEGMVKGRRTVIPGVGNRALLTPLGRFVPRTVGLPLSRAVAAAAIRLQPRVMHGTGVPPAVKEVA